MPEYIAPSHEWVRDHVERYEGSGGKEGYTLPNTDIRCIIVSHIGNKTGALRRIPLIRVKVDDSYVLIGSMGGQPKNPVWVYNLRANPDVEIRDKTDVTKMRAREVEDDTERKKLWDASVEAFPRYAEYQEKTERKIPVFLAEPV